MCLQQSHHTAMCSSLTLCYIQINSLVVRQASAPEGMSPAQRWVLTAVDEIKKKQDASDKNAPDGFKGTDLPNSHDDSESTNDDKGQVI